MFAQEIFGVEGGGLILHFAFILFFLFCFALHDLSGSMLLLFFFLRQLNFINKLSRKDE